MQVQETEAATAARADALAEVQRLAAAADAAAADAAQQLAAERGSFAARLAEQRAEALSQTLALQSAADALRGELDAARSRAAAAEALALDRAAELAACCGERDRATARVSFLQASGAVPLKSNFLRSELTRNAGLCQRVAVWARRVS